MFSTSRLTFVLMLLLTPPVVQAQTQWDIAGTVGFFGGHTPTPESPAYQEDWFETVQGGIVVGRHISRHLKLEVEATGTGTGTQFLQRSITVPGFPYPYPIASEVHTSVRSLGGALTWQFGENEWVHPFVQAGVSADFDRVTVRTWEQVFAGDPIRGTGPRVLAEERVDGPTTHRAVRGAIGGGAKVYVSERAFFRTDGRLTFDRDHQNVVFRLGFGIDF